MKSQAGKSGAAALPKREQNLFDQMLKLHESREYNKAIKKADDILGKVPDHAETMAVKALCLNSLKKKEEALALIKLAMDYESARRAYQFALKYDKDNAQILRDLIMTQMQLREYDQAVENCRALLLSKQFDQAYQVMDSYMKTVKTLPAPELNEILAFQANCLFEANKIDQLLTFLKDNEKKMREKDFYYRKLYDTCFAKGDLEQCKTIALELLKRNPDDHNNYKMLIKAHKVDPTKSEYTESEINTVVGILEEQAKIRARSSAPLMLQLRYAQGELFGKKFDEYIKSASARAVPSLFANVKSLYIEKKKVEIIENIIMKHIESLKTVERFSGSETPQDPTVLLWLLLFAANHFDQKGDHTKALELIEEAIDHTPTLVEAYTVKAKIQKHLKEAEKAAETYDVARKIDQADRYLNARCSKYMIRAGKVEEAEKTMALFVREVNGELNVHEMQCMWYEIELGKEFKRKNQLAKAYKMYKYVEQHFDTIYDDQFDYHYYALRRGNINAYLNMIKWEDKLYSHKYFIEGAIGLLKCYLKIHDAMAKTEKSAEEAKELEEIAVKDPLEDATKLAAKALKYHENNKELQEISAKAFVLKSTVVEKWLLAAKSLIFLKKNKVEMKSLEDAFFADYEKADKKKMDQKMLRSIEDEITQLKSIS